MRPIARKPGAHPGLPCLHHLLSLLCLFAVVAVSPAAAQPAPSRAPDVATRELLAHLDRLVPAALETSGVPGAAVGLIADGNVVAVRTYGFADLAERRPVTAATVFNVGSISKVAAAWAAMRLVADGHLELDAPVASYLSDWPLPPSELDERKITLRRLLSHTAGLSMAAVPEYDPRTPVPGPLDALSDPESGVRLVAEPGAAWSYSGGGYLLLQHLVEAVTGQPFEAYVREAVFAPLGMVDSSFSWTDALRATAATPYDDGEPAPHFRYAGQAAASLNTTVEDLARFAAAGLDARPAGRPRGRGVLPPETVALMQSPAPATEQQFGVRTGLGYQVWGLHDYWAVDEQHARIVGHAGQNTGWSATMWLAPATGDGIVVLTNASHGRELWRWVLCDWADGLNGTTWLGLCTDRPEALPPAPGAREVRHPADGSALPLPPFLAGELAFRDDAWPVELSLEETETSVEARLTLPDLVYADVPAEARREKDVLVLGFPFGLGEYALSPVGDSAYVARTALGGDTAVLRLRPARPRVVRRDVRFESGDASLAGTLYSPATPGPHPAVVMIQGSGPMGRGSWAYRSWGDAFARRGTAALVYDKRGVGESTGDFRGDSAFVRLAGDARAAAAHLRALPEIDASRVGLAGWSQGGWIQLRAAAGDDSTAFLVMLSPSAFTPAEQEIQSLEARMRASDFSEADVAEAVAYTRLYFYVAATGRGWDRLEAETARLPEAGWSELVQWPETPQDLAWWRRHLGVEPAAFVPEIDAPVLAFFGAEDPVVPAPANAGRLRELLSARPGSEERVLVAPDADHRLEVPAGRDAEGRWRFPRVSPLVLSEFEAWVDSQLGVGS